MGGLRRYEQEGLGVHFKTKKTALGFFTVSVCDGVGEEVGAGVLGLDCGEMEPSGTTRVSMMVTGR